MRDLIDATHFRDAAYADVLITRDENFRAVAGMASTGLKIRSFDEFARHLLAGARRTGGVDVLTDGSTTAGWRQARLQ